MYESYFNSHYSLVITVYSHFKQYVIGIYSKYIYQKSNNHLILQTQRSEISLLCNLLTEQLLIKIKKTCF